MRIRIFNSINANCFPGQRNSPNPKVRIAWEEFILVPRLEKAVRGLIVTSSFFFVSEINRSN